MTDGALTVLDGTRLRAVDLQFPATTGAVTGAQVLEMAESEVSSLLFGLSLPENLKAAALKRINIDAVRFRVTELESDQASSKLKDYVIAIADELRDDPLVGSVLDGNLLRQFLEDEDDFAMLAENLFTDLDTEDKGKISKSEIRNALVQMGVELGVPPFSEFSLLEDILKKHGAEGEEKLGQAQFAQLLQPILQELADVLAKKHVLVIQNIKISNGSQLRKLLADEKQLNNVIEQAFQDQCASKEGKGSTKIIRGFLEKNGPDLGLPPSEANEAVVSLYDQVFADVENGGHSEELARDEFVEVVRDTLEKIAELLEENPIFHGIDG